MKNICWKVCFYNLVNDDTIEEVCFDNIEDISKAYPKIPLHTWRNICLGRSKVYDRFLSVHKHIKTQ